MTTLTFAFSQAIRRMLSPGDEVVITQLDHEANRGPWLNLKDHGITVREVRLGKDGRLDEVDLRRAVGPRTRFVAMGMASNILGTVNNVKLARRLTKERKALLYLDAVHYAPHFPIDVVDLDADFLVCSAYKFYGPHVGILYCREGLLESLETDRLRTQEQEAPYRVETGTLNHAAIAGVEAAVEFIGSLGEGTEFRERILDAMRRIGEHERELAVRLSGALKTIPGITIVGPPFDDELRAPTISFTVERIHPEKVCKHLGERGICAWDGHFYAIRTIEILGLDSVGGVTRLGVVMYTTAAEVDRVIDAVRELAADRGDG